MIIDRKKAKEIAMEWGWKRLPRKGREYIRVSGLFTQWLIHDEVGFKLYFEERKSIKGGN